MRRSTFVLSLAASAVATVLVSLTYGVASQAQQSSSTDADENALGASLSKSVAGAVRTEYSLLLEHLDLTPRDKEALLAVLIEDQLAGWTVSASRGVVSNEEDEPMSEDERSNSIAAIIGYSKFEEFRALERNLPAYGEVGRIASLFQQNDVPLTDAQRDGLFEILVETRDVYETKPPADVKRHSIEFLEHQLNLMDEYQRLVMELARSVLSPQQVVYLHEQYQYLSYERAYALERQEKERADPMIEDRPLFYPAWSY